MRCQDREPEKLMLCRYVGTMKLYNSPTNSEILKDRLENYPPTLDGLGDPNSVWTRIGSIVAWIEDTLLRVPVAWRNSIDLKLLKSSVQFHPALPDPRPSSGDIHDVYLCTIPHSGWVTSAKHWSLYTQGRFYHLRNKQSPRLEVSELVDLNDLDAILEEIRIDITTDRFHRRRDLENDRAYRRPLVAYHVGQTRFVSEQVRTLGSWIMTHFSGYELLETNCHLFVLSRMNRIVMSKRDGTMFIGTKAQIANWDLRLKGQGERPYRQQLGFLVSAPSSAMSLFLIYYCTIELI